MTASAPVEESLWRVALTAFRRNIHQLGPMILGLAAFMVVADFYSLRDQLADLQNIMQNLNEHVGAINSNHTPSTVSPSAIDFSWARIISMVVQCIGYYGLTVIYLRREPITTQPVFGFKSFFYWLGRIVVAGLVVIGIGLCAVIAGGAIAFATNAAMHKEAQWPVMCASIVAVLVLIYSAVRFAPVGPMALSGIDSPLKNSWNMTRGHWWLIFWEYLMAVSILWVALLGICLLPILALCFFTTEQSPAFIGGLAIMMSITKATVLAGGSVYFCCLTRKLIQKQGLPKAL